MNVKKKNIAQFSFKLSITILSSNYKYSSHLTFQAQIINAVGNSKSSPHKETCAPFNDVFSLKILRNICNVPGFLKSGGQFKVYLHEVSRATRVTRVSHDLNPRSRNLRIFFLLVFVFISLFKDNRRGFLLFSLYPETCTCITH